MQHFVAKFLTRKLVIFKIQGQSRCAHGKTWAVALFGFRYTSTSGLAIVTVPRFFISALSD